MGRSLCVQLDLCLGLAVPGLRFEHFITLVGLLVGVPALVVVALLIQTLVRRHRQPR